MINDKKFPSLNNILQLNDLLKQLNSLQVIRTNI